MDFTYFLIIELSNFHIIKLIYEQDRELFQRQLPWVIRESDLAFMDTVAAKHCDCPGSHRYHNSYGMGDGFFEQPVIKADLFII